jgi:hypothetical protein
MIISTQAVSWPSHYHSMILPRMSFTKSVQILNSLCKRSIRFINTDSIKLSALVFLEQGFNFSPMTAYTTNISLFLFCIFPEENLRSCLLAPTCN